MTSSNLKDGISFKHAWLASCGAAALAIIVAGTLIPMYFGTNDDPYVIQVLSGGGGVASKPLPFVPFINFGLCWIISSLYSVLPMIPWWIIFNLLSIFVSLSLINNAILMRIFKSTRGIRYLPTFFFILIVNLGVSSYFVGRLQFTNTSALLVAAAIIATCSGLPQRENKRGILILAGVVGTIGFALRAQSGLLGLFFWGITAFCLIMQASGNVFERLKSVRDTLLPLFIAVIGSLILILLNTVAYSSSDLEASLKLQQAYGGFTDYPYVAYSQDPSRYQAVGWDEELTELVGQWFLMDDRITTENLTELNEQNTAAIDELVEHPWSTVLSRLHYISQPIPMCYLALLLGVAVTAFAFSTSRWERITAWVICGSVVLLLGYLLLQGRLPERAAYAVTIPATAALLSIVLRNAYAVKEKGHSVLSPTIAFVIGVTLLTPLFYGAAAIGRLAFGLGVLYCLTILVWSAFMYRKGFSKKWMTGITAALAILLILSPGAVTLKKLGVGSWEAKHQEELLANTEAFFNYVNEHPDTLYIYAGCPMTMQYVWQDAWPTNQTGWGGWRWPYEWFDEAMRAAGFDGRPTSEDFLDGDAVFVSSSKSTCDLLLRYMRNTFGEDVQMVQIDEIAGGMKVYQFVRAGEQ